jgi:hypothetical protein
MAGADTCLRCIMANANVVVALFLSCAGGPAKRHRDDSRSVRLKLKLAALFLESYEAGKGVQVLKDLNSASIPFAKRGAVLALLAIGHYKLWQTAECDSCLAAVTALGSSHGLSRVELLRLAMLGCKNLLRSARPLDALRRVDASISEETRLSDKGHLLLLRGRILQNLAAHSRAGDKSMLPPGCGSHLDVSRAAAEAMQMAFEAFALVGNRQLEALAASLYAHVRLDAVWWTHVLYNKPWEVSLIATAPNHHSRDMPLSPALVPRDSSMRSRRRCGSNNNLNSPFGSRVLGRPASADPRSYGSGVSGGNGKETDALRSIERASTLALDEAMLKLSNVHLLVHAHLNMAQTRWLQGNEVLTLAHLNEARDVFFGLFVRPAGRVVVADGPVSFARSLLSLLNRCACVLCMVYRLCLLQVPLCILVRTYRRVRACQDVGHSGGDGRKLAQAQFRVAGHSAASRSRHLGTTTTNSRSRHCLARCV